MATKKQTIKQAKKVIKNKPTTKKVVAKPVSSKDVDWHRKSNPNKEKKILIDIQNITKWYGHKEVLKPINLKIYEGERLAIIGPNGTGKSTLTEIIAGIKEATSGKIDYVFGKSKADITKNIGIQFQETVYPMFVKVSSIVQFFMDAAGVKLPKDKLFKLLETFNLTGIWNQMAEGLSGGQKQRMNILLAVIHEPKLLLLDEVSTGLDVETRTNVKKFIKAYLDRTNSTSIIVSHNTDEVMALADRIVVIYDGQIHTDRSLESIIKEYKVFDKFIDDLFLVKFKKLKDEKDKQRNLINEGSEKGKELKKRLKREQKERVRKHNEEMKKLEKENKLKEGGK